MARKCVVWSVPLDHEVIELLPYNAKRINARIYSDTWFGAGVLAIGHSRAQAESATITSIYYLPIVWEGINNLWAWVPTGVNTPQNITVIELVED